MSSMSCFRPTSTTSQRKQWHPTPVLLPGKSHGPRSLVGCSPWGRKELDMTERLQFHFSLSCTGEGNGNPPQCSCLENPRDRGAWWVAVYGVAQRWTRLKQLSSSSSSNCVLGFPDDSEGKAFSFSAEDPDLIPGLGRTPGGGVATTSSILAWRTPWTGTSVPLATVRGVAESRTGLSG